MGALFGDHLGPSFGQLDHLLEVAVPLPRVVGLRGVGSAFGLAISARALRGKLAAHAWMNTRTGRRRSIRRVIYVR